MTQAIPVAFVIRLALIRQRRGFTVADEEQVAEHFHFAALLAIAQQRRHVHAQMLAQQVKHRRFDPGHYVNCGTQIEGLQTASTGVAVGESIAHGGQHVFVFTQRLTDHQRDRVLQGGADFLSAGDFTDAGMAGIIFDHHDIAREERGVRAAQVHQHAVVARDRNDLHRRNNGGRKLCAHNLVLIQISDGRKRGVYGQKSIRGSGTALGLRHYARRRAAFYTPHALSVPAPSPAQRQVLARPEQQFFRA